jgi:hypothetical protein
MLFYYNFFQYILRLYIYAAVEKNMNIMPTAICKAHNYLEWETVTKNLVLFQRRK